MTLPARPPRAVIWDMDGVICDTGPYHYRSWRKVMAERGVTLTEECFRRGFGRRNDAIIRGLLGGEVPPEEIEKISRKKESFFRRIVRGRLEPLPGVLTLLDSLHNAGYRMALASSAPLTNINLILRELGIAGFFEAVVSGEDVTEGKPSPQVFLLAAARLGVAPAGCLVIEDAVAGVTAARRAGMLCLAVTNTHPAKRLAAARLVVSSLAEVGLADIEAIFEKSEGVAG
ncbi:MAG: HAD family phosphatase [Chloroflexota bacterium]